ncbi:Flp pilus assembly protein CpaB [Methylomicrobium lacus]|uniref:Flp pilus assembly protein CpaB n=1 Tax=Methylomicrobium lacus TaxID=136992 RepID=UPI00045E89C8|nr:Flp pilus assembly protein CpaB [Methylomicrobium lacus]
MNSRFLIMLIIALTLAAGAAWIANSWVESQTSRQANVEQNTIPVYVAANYIPYAGHIDQTQIKLVDWPKDMVPKEAFTQADTASDAQAIVGKIAQREFYPGEILLKPQIKNHVGGSSLSALIPEGMRAISVRVDDVAGVAGFILPGNKADIIVNRGEETFTLLKNIKILAIDQQASTEGDKNAIVVRALTLEVTPKQAEILVNAMRSGTLQFTLRNPMDSSESSTVVASTPSSPETKKIKPIAPLTVKILPWTSQSFKECKDNSC